MDLSEWSEEVFSLRDIVDKGLPNVVRVSEGFFSESDEDQSFSQGDTLHLHSIQEIRYVEARYLIDPEKSVEFIPVDCNGKVVIIEDVGKIFKSVKEVLEEMPRFVRTESIVAAEVADDNKLNPSLIPPGTKIEILENCLDRGLKCTYRGRIMIVGNKQTVSFALIEDTNEYHVKDVVQRRNLPIVVEFVQGNDEFLSNDIKDCVNNYKTFSGRYILSSLVTKKQVIGHYKPNTLKVKNTLPYDKRTAFILPYDSKALTEIEVREPVYIDRPYEKPLVCNFEALVPDANPVYGSVLVLFENMKIRTQGNFKHVLEDDIPPELPKRSSLPGRIKCSSHDDVYCTVGDGIENGSSEVQNDERSKGSSHDDVYCTVGDEIENGSSEVQNDERSKGRNELTILKEIQKNKKPKRKRNSSRSMSLPGVSSVDLAVSSVTYSVKHKDRQIAGSPDKQEGRSFFKYASGLRKRLLRKFSSSGDLTKVSTEDSLALGETKRRDKRKSFSPEKYEAQFTYFELARRLRMHGFIEEAEVCEKHRLDDWIFLTCETEELSENLSLTKVQIFKIRNVCQGWLPAQRFSLPPTSDITEILL